MNVCDLSLDDHDKLRQLGERLWDISVGRLTTRGPLLSVVGELMVCVRDDCCADAAEEVVDRLLSLADDRLGAEALAEAALAEILARGQ